MSETHRDQEAIDCRASLKIFMSICPSSTRSAAMLVTAIATIGHRERGLTRAGADSANVTREFAAAQL
jgi:hypothetical protein